MIYKCAEETAALHTHACSFAKKTMATHTHTHSDGDHHKYTCRCFA